MTRRGLFAMLAAAFASARAKRRLRNAQIANEVFRETLEQGAVPLRFAY
jgi:hypothetical protein